jgi:hypothetical protein
MESVSAPEALVGAREAVGTSCRPSPDREESGDAPQRRFPASVHPPERLPDNSYSRRNENVEKSLVGIWRAWQAGTTPCEKWSRTGKRGYEGREKG